MLGAPRATRGNGKGIIPREARRSEPRQSPGDGPRAARLCLSPEMGFAPVRGVRTWPRICGERR
eukprot:scaffold536_cov250-Pinguiococcus_pyrenoidosus.AAC.8